MSHIKNDPALYQKKAENHVDYSEIYRTEETNQLNKRLRKTRNILLVCAAALLTGAGVFWIMPETSFITKDFMIYFAVAVLIVLLSVYSKKHPYYSILAALIICLGFWGMEIFLRDNDDLLIEGSIQKLFIVSLLVSCFHSSKEAELIRKELHFL